MQYLKQSLSHVELIALTVENDKLMNEEGEPPEVDEMELGKLDLPTLFEAVKKGKTKNILLHQLNILAELYNAISKDKKLPK